jgi:hypothetical protein
MLCVGFMRTENHLTITIGEKETETLIREERTIKWMK